jgi:hypothetical protein
MAERAFTILAGMLLLAAAVMLWRSNLSAAFVLATLGIVAWFLSYRTQLRAKIASYEASDNHDEIDED